METKDGLVLWEDHFYPEIIDPQTGAVLPEGAEGELVLTSLSKEGFPVIRYRTRDRTRLLPPTARAMRRLARINARTDDMLIVRGVNVFPSQLEELILASGVFSPAYLLELEREGHLDSLTVNVEWARSSPAGRPSEEAAAKALTHHIKSSVGISVRVRILTPGVLERSAGKARRVIDRRPQG